MIISGSKWKESILIIAASLVQGCVKTRQEAVHHQAGEKNVDLTGSTESVETLETAQAMHLREMMQNLSSCKSFLID